jgi:uncharacterized BrkB/YihY/UPF0761 family membrane protein
MHSLKATADAFQRSRVGRFVKKIMDDRAPNLAAILAWGTLSAILPLILGMLSLAGLVLRDQRRVDELWNTLLSAVPQQATAVLGDALEGVRQSAAPAGVIALALLLVNGSGFFANMGSVFDLAYHVDGRNLLAQRLVALAMLLITTALLILSTLAAGLRRCAPWTNKPCVRALSARRWSRPPRKPSEGLRWRAGWWGLRGCWWRC